jgi:hypothetical protein
MRGARNGHRSFLQGVKMKDERFYRELEKRVKKGLIFVSCVDLEKEDHERRFSRHKIVDTCYLKRGIYIDINKKPVNIEDW